MSKENGVNGANLQSTSTTSLGDGRLLTHLLQEAAANSITDLQTAHKTELSDDSQLKSMIENYQSHVLQEQQRQNFRFYQPNTQNQHQQPSISHSQPCLFMRADSKTEQWNDIVHNVHSSDPRDTNEWTNAITSLNSSQDNNKVSTVVLKTSDVQALRNENAFLKHQVDVLQRKANKLKQLEVAYERIENDFEQVLTQREKQEKLEKAALMKMEQQIQLLTSENELLQQQMERMNFQPMTSQANFDPQAIQAQAEQVIQLNMLLNEIIPQNKELMALKEAQNATLEEQRNHIDMLEKALTNAQERLAAKDRQAMDAAAVVEKCNQLQKLLQESVDEKMKLQEDLSKEKTHLEKELTQLRMHMAKEGLNKKSSCSVDHDDYASLKRDLATRDEKITYLERHVREIQKEYDETLKRRQMTNRVEIEALMTKVQKLEAEKYEKERRIQELLEEKRHIQDQWTDERRTLDLRVRLLEEDLKRIMSSSYGQPALAGYDAVYPTSSSMGDLASKGSTVSVYNDPMVRMEELRLKIAERRSSTGSWYFGGVRAKPKDVPLAYLSGPSSNHSRRSSGGSLPTDHLRTISMPVDSEFQLGVPPIMTRSVYGPMTTSAKLEKSGHERQKSSDSLKQQQQQISDYIASLPAATRRRFEAAANISSSGDSKSTLSGIQMGTSGLKRVLREKSMDKNRVTGSEIKNGNPCTAAKTHLGTVPRKASSSKMEKPEVKESIIAQVPKEANKHEPKFQHTTTVQQQHASLHSNPPKRPTLASEVRKRGTIARSVSFDDEDPDMPIETATINNDVVERQENGAKANETKRNSLTTCTVVEVNKEKLQISSNSSRRHSLDDRKNQDEINNV